MITRIRLLGLVLVFSVGVAAAQDASPQAAQGAPAGVNVIAGNAVQGRLIKQVPPIYPADGMTWPDGDVVIDATIAKDGTVQDVKVTSGAPQLAGSAVHAVSQWVYLPYRVDGVAIPVHTTIRVHFFHSAPKNIGGTPAPDPATMAVWSRVSKPVLPAPPPGVMRISGGVMSSMLKKRVEPVYPADSIALDARGSEVLLITVSKTGEVGGIQIVSGPLRFRNAAAEAVKQWKYRPYLIDNNPVDVQTMVTLNFAPPH